MSNKDVDGLKEKAIELETRVQKVVEATKAVEQEKAQAVNGPMFSTGRSTSIEQKAMTYFGVNHPVKLLSINTADQRYAMVPNELKSVVIELKNRVDTARYIAQLFHGAQLDKDENIRSAGNYFDSYFAKHELVPYLKAFGSTVSGQGDEWVPTALSSLFIEEFRLERKLAGLYKEIKMATNPFEIPVQSGLYQAQIVAEGAQATSQNFTTSKLTLTARKLGAYSLLPEELNEDSAPAMIALLKEQLMTAQIDAMETALINGDLTATHQDSDTTAAADARKLFKGLRKMGIDNSANGGTVTFSSAVTAAKLDTMRKNMGKFGVNPKQNYFLASPSAYHQMLGLEEVSTVEKFGPQATILSGALAAFRGIPIIMSEYVREDLNASGVYDGVTVDNTTIVLANSTRGYIGNRRAIQMKIVADQPDYDRYKLASYQRVDFQHMPQSATEVSVVVGIDVTK